MDELNAGRGEKCLYFFRLMSNYYGDVIGRGDALGGAHYLFDQCESAGAMEDFRALRLHASAQACGEDHHVDGWFHAVSSLFCTEDGKFALGRAAAPGQVDGDVGGGARVVAHDVAVAEQIGSDYLHTHFRQAVDFVHDRLCAFGGVLPALAGADGASIDHHHVEQLHAGVPLDGIDVIGGAKADRKSTRL